MNPSALSQPPLSPKVSVVIPVYNAEQYLQAALRSVVGQGEAPSWEVIMVDDGSVDGSSAICRQWAENDRRFRYFRRENRGQAAARNFGTEQARGEYISFLDADDALLPGALKTLVEIARETQSPIAVGGFTRKEATDGKVIDEEAPKVEVFAWREIVRRGLYQSLLVNNPWGAVYQRRLFDEGLRFREGIIYEDLDFFYRAFEAAWQVAYTPLKVYFYRPNPTGTTGQFSLRRMDVLDVTDRIVAYMGEHHPSLLEAALDRRFSAHFNILGLTEKAGLHRADHPDHAAYEGLKRRCLNIIRSRRLAELVDPRVRLRNKLGAAAAFLPEKLLLWLLRVVGV